MNIQETSALLMKIRLVDSRVVDEAVIREWHDILADVDFADAVDAVRNHRRVSTEYLQPAHVVAGAAVAGVERARRERRVWLDRVESLISAGELEGTVEDYAMGLRNFNELERK